ncbi:MAG: hypothetical protein HOP15_11780 [Planctomycetes bacterium]|nr:hypothetical protein [Planctomycetota bacterium]
MHLLQSIVLTPQTAVILFTLWIFGSLALTVSWGLAGWVLSRQPEVVLSRCS